MRSPFQVIADYSRRKAILKSLIAAFATVPYGYSIRTQMLGAGVDPVTSLAIQDFVKARPDLVEATHHGQDMVLTRCLDHRGAISGELYDKLSHSGIILAARDMARMTGPTIPAPHWSFAPQAADALKVEGKSKLWPT